MFHTNSEVYAVSTGHGCSHTHC